MRPLIVKQLDYDLTPVAGLSLVGHLLNTLKPVLADIDRQLAIRGGVANSDVVRSYLGLLVQGKSDFDAIETFRGDVFFKHSLGIELLPSSPTLRQRMDAKAHALFEFVPAMIQTLLQSQRADYGTLPCGWLALDVDTFAMDNGGTAKEGVGPPMLVWTVIVRSQPTWARTGTAWSWRCARVRSTRSARRRSTLSASSRWPSA